MGRLPHFILSNIGEAHQIFQHPSQHVYPVTHVQRNHKDIEDIARPAAHTG